MSTLLPRNTTNIVSGEEYNCFDVPLFERKIGRIYCDNSESSLANRSRFSFVLRDQDYISEIQLQFTITNSCGSEDNITLIPTPAMIDYINTLCSDTLLDHIDGKSIVQNMITDGLDPMIYRSEIDLEYGDAYYSVESTNKFKPNQSKTFRIPIVNSITNNRVALFTSRENIAINIDISVMGGLKLLDESCEDLNPDLRGFKISNIFLIVDSLVLNSSAKINRLSELTLNPVRYRVVKYIHSTESRSIISTYTHSSSGESTLYIYLRSTNTPTGSLLYSSLPISKVKLLDSTGTKTIAVYDRAHVNENGVMTISISPLRTYILDITSEQNIDETYITLVQTISSFVEVDYISGELYR